jgi:hypothetical protein
MGCGAGFTGWMGGWRGEGGYRRAAGQGEGHTGDVCSSSLRWARERACGLWFLKALLP